MKHFPLFSLVILLLALTGCATVPPKDYTEFRKSRPKSILVLPPANSSADVRASYSVLTTTTRPISELGYYVIPVVLADQLLKENGFSLPAEMHQAPLTKLNEVFGADAVLYLEVLEYGTKYMVIASTTVVRLKARLVDARSGAVLWDGAVRTEGGGQSGLIEAVVNQVMSKLMDQAHIVATMASHQLTAPPGQGLIRGHRHPEAGKD